jgi:hypothetical protein
MNCCPNADITILEKGLLASERNLQAEGHTLQFFPFRAIQTIRYTHTRGDGGTLSIWVLANGSPGAGGLAYKYHFPCGDTGKRLFEDIMTKF